MNHIKLSRLTFALFSIVLTFCAVSPLAIYGSEIQAAARNGDLLRVQYLVNHGADINEFETIEDFLKYNNVTKSRHYSCGLTALQCAAQNGRLEVVRWLAEHGAYIDLKDKRALYLKLDNKYFSPSDSMVVHGKTALFYAAENGHLEIAKYLLDHGADVKAKDSDNKTVFYYVSEKKNWEMLRFLIDHGLEAPYPFYWLYLWLRFGCSSILITLMIQDKVFIFTLLLFFFIHYIKSRKVKKDILNAIRDLQNAINQVRSKDIATNPKNQNVMEISGTIQSAENSDSEIHEPVLCEDNETNFKNQNDGEVSGTIHNA